VPGTPELPIAEYCNDGSLLAYGNGRSYGDSCLNSGGFLLDTAQLNHFMAFDEATGVLRCESGARFNDILNLCVPRGWCLPVLPGTQYLTVGGAIANDVHGKNHHSDGTFGCFVICFELLRSDGSRLRCSAQQNTELFEASIGGLGLTGLILWAEVQLIPLSSPKITVTTKTFSTVEEFVQLSDASAHSSRYSVAWLDCMPSNVDKLKGLFYEGNHDRQDAPASLKTFRLQPPRLNIPVNMPSMMLNRHTVSLFNLYYFHRNKTNGSDQQQSFSTFFYPLDGITNWNRIYGRRGFFQIQLVVPEKSIETIKEILRLLSKTGMASFLAVLKKFGDKKSPGLLSFPREGICLALDITNRGDKSLRLLDQIETLVLEGEGAVYPAKDRHMSAMAFRNYFPLHERFVQYIDPAFESDFWLRVSGR